MNNVEHTDRMVSKKIVSVESDYEMRSRLRIEEEKQAAELRLKEASASHHRLMEMIQTFVMLVASLGIGSFCLYVSLSNHFQSDEKNWARSIFQIIVGAVVGFITGKSSQKNNTS